MFQTGFKIYFFHYSELVLDWDSCCEFIDQSLVQLYTNVSYKLNILQPKVKSAAADLKTKEISWGPSNLNLHSHQNTRESESDVFH